MRSSVVGWDIITIKTLYIKRLERDTYTDLFVICRACSAILRRNCTPWSIWNPTKGTMNSSGVVVVHSHLVTYYWLFSMLRDGCGFLTVIKGQFPLCFRLQSYVPYLHFACLLSKVSIKTTDDLFMDLIIFPSTYWQLSVDSAFFLVQKNILSSHHSEASAAVSSRCHIALVAKDIRWGENLRHF